MTTIAYDGKALVTDGRCCTGTTIVSDKFEKVMETDDLLYAFSGDAGAASKWLLEFVSGGDPEPVAAEDAAFSVMAIDKKTKKVGMSYSGGPFMQIEHPAAMGSGGDIAIGAMLAGKSAKEAVKLAIKRDAASGGRITEIVL